MTAKYFQEMNRQCVIKTENRILGPIELRTPIPVAPITNEDTTPTTNGSSPRSDDNLTDDVINIIDTIQYQNFQKK